ncbi:DUF1707 SHOCT-like domain-containing protein [Nocardiopsis lambiniae]|uniref:DUF1707 domain-containing protein n=1 Tax=Nocardiopsis lambiniae TaxID=3075539 RepID=A0ABU2M6X2_9ACTN|nr:DUF1707 domain-containing protein [Nocardiopsis sp. DSM 44743]MDT0327971.1 DUF1707 domain-containing protein [Nocardiopsis sp. DSM 44743]
MAGPEPASYRISDGERDEALESLRTAVQEGRLTLDEHEERSATALRAVTNLDLVPLFEDLPDHLRPRPAALAVPASESGPVDLAATAAKVERRKKKDGDNLAGVLGWGGFLLFVWGVPTFVSGNVTAISVFLGFFCLMVVPGLITALARRRRRHDPGPGEVTRG